MPKQSSDTGLIRLDLYIDPDLHPELFRTLTRISEGKRRAAYVKNCAEKFLLLEKTMFAGHGMPSFDDSSATYLHGNGKLQKSAMQLTGDASVSSSDVADSTHHDEVLPKQRGVQPPATQSREQTGKKPAMRITTTAVVSSNNRGSAALAGVLDEMTPGL